MCKNDVIREGWAGKGRDLVNKKFNLKASRTQTANTTPEGTILANDV